MENYKFELQPCLKAFQTAVQCYKFCDMWERSLAVTATAIFWISVSKGLRLLSDGTTDPTDKNHVQTWWPKSSTDNIFNWNNQHGQYWIFWCVLVLCPVWNTSNYNSKDCSQLHCPKNLTKSNGGPQIFQKCKSHLQIPGARRMT
jgi:hypothetical protein